MPRKKLLIANWKLNHNRSTAQAFFAKVSSLEMARVAELAVAPVAPMLDFVGRILLDNPAIALAAQNVFYEAKGAYTGEWAAEHLVELGVKFCLVGHSERRQIFHENDDVVIKKSRACIQNGITPVVCVGESAQQRQEKTTALVIEQQIDALLIGLSPTTNIVFAYEPIWAIGTGKQATGYQADEVHEIIRTRVTKTWGPGLAEQIRIIYGGSVTPENISELIAMPNVDGGLVGGASLQAESFLSMVEKFRGAH